MHEKRFKFKEERPAGNTFWWALKASAKSVKRGAEPDPPVLERNLP
jgi:hypothetical protein